MAGRPARSSSSCGQHSRPGLPPTVADPLSGSPQSLLESRHTPHCTSGSGIRMRAAKQRALGAQPSLTACRGGGGPCSRRGRNGGAAVLRPHLGRSHKSQQLGGSRTRSLGCQLQLGLHVEPGLGPRLHLLAWAQGALCEGLLQPGPAWAVAPLCRSPHTPLPGCASQRGPQDTCSRPSALAPKHQADTAQPPSPGRGGRPRRVPAPPRTARLP